MGMMGNRAARSPAALRLGALDGLLGNRDPMTSPDSIMPDMGPVQTGGMNPMLPGALANIPKIKRPFLSQDGMGTGNRIFGAVGDLLAAAAGGQPVYAPMMAQRRAADDAQRQWRERFDLQKAADAESDMRRANAPQFFDGNQDRVRYDPTTGATSVVYDAPTDAENYAHGLGLTPGTPDYQDSMRDYVLRSSGPTAFQGRNALEGTRAGYRSQLASQRFGQQVALRQSPTFRQMHPAPHAGGRGGGGRSSGVGEGQTATGPGGHKIVMRGGRWVDMQSGRPVG